MSARAVCCGLFRSWDDLVPGQVYHWQPDEGPECREGKGCKSVEKGRDT